MGIFRAVCRKGRVVRIPYRYLIIAVLVLALAVTLLPAVIGSSETAADNEHLIVIERVEPEENIIYSRNNAFMVSDDVLGSAGVTFGELKVGSWWILSYSDEAEHAHKVEKLRPAPADHLELTGTVKTLLIEEGSDGNRFVGMAINNFTVYFAEPLERFHIHGSSEGAVPDAGDGVRVVAMPADPERGLNELVAIETPEIIRSHDLLHAITLLMLQIAVILLVAKVGGEVFERYFKQPGVLGELIGGMIISPYAFGRLIALPGFGPLFETVNLSTTLDASPFQPNFAVSPELWAMAQLAAIILLFMAGLETNLRQFMRYAGPATIIGMGGVITPFFLGAFATEWLIPGISSMWDPTALFMGAVMVATSVGITARVLSDINRLDTSEGVTILAGAVIDDVLGILVLAIVNAISIAELANRPIEVGLILEITLKAVLFWLGLTGIGILASKKIESFLNWFKTKGATFGLGLALAFACAATAELFGLAMIIGAYSIGLALSERELAHFLEDQLASVYNFVVPIFFVVMGMMVDFNQMLPLLWPYGVVISFFAVISKVFGCGIPALFVGFNLRGAIRVGLGMLPRGEVALIIAGIGIANGVIATDMFGVAILLTLVTTLMAPPALVPAFKMSGPGTHREVKAMRKKPVEAEPKPVPTEPFIKLPTLVEAQQTLLRDIIIAGLENTGYARVFSDPTTGVYEMSKGDSPVVIRTLPEQKLVTIDAPEKAQDQIRVVIREIAETMAAYRDVLKSAIEA